MILLIAVAILAWLALQKFKSSTPQERRKLIVQWTLVAVALAAVLLAISGRLHWVGAAIAAILPIANRLWRTFGRHIPWLAPLIAKHAQARQQKKDNRQGQQSDSDQSGQDQFQQQQKPHQPNLTIAEARQVLSVSADATREEIIGAHRRLIQKFHPDRGGNDYLASRINAAKALLLKQFD
ncbi:MULTISPECIES: J domain-containing protein [Microbulbifer]|uniref:Molecular chaperone DnaJ n=1 Tax=Microbulbifer celer TaxID=435905 RepID=A0ABW3U7I7_9GAMM|nr:MULTISPECIES: molecular chaperone DnaJ [Microbulbifer]UFN59218.1 molecular chaperone DnaJ [Microbulbifer celer]